MHWRDNVADIGVVREVVLTLSSLGYSPGVAFDANAGYLISGKYMNERAFSQILGLPLDRILVVGKGTPADPAILGAARDLGARIVSNDRYRDWAADHPEVATPGHLVRGGYREGRSGSTSIEPGRVRLTFSRRTPGGVQPGRSSSAARLARKFLSDQ